MPIRISGYWRQFLTTKQTAIYKSKACKFYTSQNSLIIDCDKIRRAKNMREPVNDFIVLDKSDLFYVGIVEFKGNNPDIRHAIVQLHSGKRIAEQIIKDSKIKQKPEMYMILVSPRKPSSRALLMAMKKRGLKTGVPFKPIRCCRSFSGIRKPPSRAGSRRAPYRKTAHR